MGAALAYESGGGGSGNAPLSAPQVVQDTATHNFTDTALHTLETLNFTTATAGQVLITALVKWKSGGTTQGLNLQLSLDSVNVPDSNASVMISSDVNDVVMIPIAVYVNMSAGAHTLTLAVAAANLAANYSVMFSQLAVR